MKILANSIPKVELLIYGINFIKQLSASVFNWKLNGVALAPLERL
jgi:hypothetical protein